jgi:hypothetical protein
MSIKLPITLPDKVYESLKNTSKESGKSMSEILGVYADIIYRCCGIPEILISHKGSNKTYVHYNGELVSLCQGVKFEHAVDAQLYYEIVKVKMENGKPMVNESTFNIIREAITVEGVKDID